MSSLWQRMTLNRFVVLGRVGMDLYADPPGTPIESATRYTTAIGGSAGNIAVALARQGAQAALLSRVSDDAVGRYCVAELARYGVETGQVRVSGGAVRTSLAVAETRAVGCQTVLYRNGAADFSLTVNDVDAVAFSGVAALIVTGTALAAEPSRTAVTHAMARAKAAGAITVLDLDYRAYSWASAGSAASICLKAAKAADVVIGNDEEFGLLAGEMNRGKALARDLAQQGAFFTIYKRGAEGATTFTPDFSFDTPIFPVQALKPMGAGDGFIGGLLAGLAMGLALDHAVKRGAATAAMIVSGVGCAPASPDRVALDAFMAAHLTR